MPVLALTTLHSMSLTVTINTMPIFRIIPRTLKTLHIAISLQIVIVAVIVSLPHTAMAQSTLDVDFENDPLFLNANVTPGDSTTRTVTVTNNGELPEAVYMDFQGTFDTGLAGAMVLAVDHDGTSYFSDTFADAFATSPTGLGTLGPGDTKTYTFTASLDTNSGNEHQESELGFELIIGFAGGEQVTDSPRPQPLAGGGIAGRGSGLVLQNEAVAIDGDSATISWDTNRNATSYVVCGLLDSGTFTLTELPPYFGYQFTLSENESLRTSHSLTETGLEAGEYECRPASRRGTDEPFTIGRAVTFTIGEPPDGQVAGETTLPQTPAPLPQQPPSGSVLGLSKSEMGGMTYDEWRAERDQEAIQQGADTESPEDIPTDTTASTDNNVNDTEPTLAATFVDQLTESPTRTGLGILALLVFILLGFIATRRYISR